MKHPDRKVSDAAWSKSVRIARELDRVLNGNWPMQEAVSRAAVALRLSTRQVYNHPARYREDRRVSSLLPRTNGARRARISTGVDAIIGETLREMWLRPEQPDLAPIVDEIRARSAGEGLVPPAYITVAKRIPQAFTPEEIARQRLSGGKRLHRLKPRPEYIRATRTRRLERLINDLLRLDTTWRVYGDRKSLAERLAKCPVPVDQTTSTIPHLSHRVRHDFFRRLSEGPSGIEIQKGGGLLNLWVRLANAAGNHSGLVGALTDKLADKGGLQLAPSVSAPDLAALLEARSRLSQKQQTKPSQSVRED